jgi:MOSC domain-containing protein YiiM
MIMSGKLLHIHIAPAASYEMEELSEAVLVPGKGIEGDRYFKGNGTYSDRGGPREVTLIEMETLEALEANQPPKQDGPIKLEPGDHRRNLTTRGVPLNHFIGKRFRVGEVILEGARINYPCKYLEELLGMPLFMPLYNRSGLNCLIEVGGTIRPGDPVSLIEN